MAMAAPPLRFPAPSAMGPSGANGIGGIAGPSNPAQLFQPYYLRPAYRFKSNTPRDDVEGGPGRRLRKNVANVRRHIDYVATVLNHIEDRMWQRTYRDRRAVQVDGLYQNAILPPASTTDTPVDCILTKFVRAAMNKAHDTAIRALRWSHNDQWLVSADHDGFVKYWQPNMNNVHMYQAHKNEAIRCISFAPTDVKLATASDDGTARVWDFARCSEERILRGHGSDVRTVDWHPQKGLLVTGSRDSQQPVKIWDPKTGSCLATLHDHKNSVMAVQWNKNGNWLLTGSRDHLIKMYDIRMMREVRSFRGHKKEVTSLAWHPIHEGLFVSGGGDGSLAYWLVNNEKEVGLLEHAHDQAVWTLEWHPLGHILASGSNDNNTKFWSRNKPGDTQDDIFGLASFSNTSNAVLNTAPVPVVPSAAVDADKDNAGEEDASKTSAEPNVPVIPGMGLDDDIYQEMNRDVVSGSHVIPGLGGGPLLFPDDPNARSQQANIGAKRTLIKQPPPKRAQRQFERMWNVAKPGGGDELDDDFHSADHSGPDAFHRPKASLLGPPPPTSMLGPPSIQQTSPNGQPVGGGQGYPPPSLPGGPPPIQSQQQQQHWPPQAPPSSSGQQQSFLPPMLPMPPLGPMWQLGGGPLPPSAAGGLPQPPIHGDIDYRMADRMGGPGYSVDGQLPSSADVDLRSSLPMGESESWRTMPNDRDRDLHSPPGGAGGSRDPRLRQARDPREREFYQGASAGPAHPAPGNNPNQIPLGSGAGSDIMANAQGSRDPRRRAAPRDTPSGSDYDMENGGGGGGGPKRGWQQHGNYDQQQDGGGGGGQSRYDYDDRKRPRGRGGRGGGGGGGRRGRGRGNDHRK
uniref:Uncharacterized protein n=1 Tax=Plectus sambesii TaxID=2011161 RepID=A0A914WSN5_9BILA